MSNSYFVNNSNSADLLGLISALQQKINSNINCISIGYIDSYDNENRVSKVILYNKNVLGIGNDGEHILSNYPPIFAKTLFIGSNSCGIDWEIKQGDECIVFFCDREIETPWLSGQVSDVKYGRKHNITDAICLTGFRTLPKTTPTNKNLNLKAKNGIIYLDGNTTINGNLIVNGNLTVSGDATIGGISFLNHVHGNGNQGQDTTKPKA